MKRTATSQALYRTERERVRRDREQAFARIMEEAKREYAKEVEASRLRGKGGRPRKDAKRAVQPVSSHEGATDEVDE